MMVIGVELKLKKRDLCVVITNICVIIIMHVERAMMKGKEVDETNRCIMCTLINRGKTEKYSVIEMMSISTHPNERLMNTI